MSYSASTRRTAYDRIRAEQARRRVARQLERADRPDLDGCICGWITARDVCPNCGCVRAPGGAR